jgi:hypothetical protein
MTHRTASSTRGGQRAPYPTGSDPRRWWALVLLCLAQFMVILDITVVNVALPTIGADRAWTGRR